MDTIDLVFGRLRCSNCNTNLAEKKGNYYRSECSSCRKKKYRIEFTMEEIMKGCPCGFIPLHPIQMDVHHIDGNRFNPEKENLKLLCANCHRLERIY